MMVLVVVTDSGGFVGSETARSFTERGWEVVDIDNDMRAQSSRMRNRTLNAMRSPATVGLHRR